MASMVQKYSGKSTPEKSNFAQTCNLLSQYLKERGNLGDIINRKLDPPGPEAARGAPATTLNLLPNMENSYENSKENKSIDFFPQFVGFPPAQDSSTKPQDFRNPCLLDPASNQMTIFYAGKVMVFDDFPAEKAKEVMALAAACKGSSNATSAGFTSLAAAKNSPVEQLKCLDLPIARRASLHRFFEKRRDRVIAKAPYQINNRSGANATSKPEQRNPWLELEAQSSRQLELKL